MKIEDLIQLMNNRLREFKLSRDYSRMSGDVERMNTAEKEIIALEDTLYQLNLLVDTSKSAAVKEVTLTESIIDGSVSVLGDYDITSYATDPLHEQKVMNILTKMGVMDTAEQIDEYITDKYLSSPISGEMVMNAALAYDVDTRLIMAIMEQDSSMGTAGLAVSTLNPGNVGNDDDGNIRTYESWQEGVTAVAEWLNRHRISEDVPEVSPTTSTTTPMTATSTPSTATSTAPVVAPATTISTTTISTTTPTTATSSPVTTISTTTTSTTTPMTATSTPSTATSTAPVVAPVTTISTTTTSTTTPSTVTPAEETIPDTVTPVEETASTTTSTSTPIAATPVEEAAPIINSTTTTVIGTTTDQVNSTISPQESSWQPTTTQETATTTAN
jgi:hypothetical protein